MRIFLLLIVLCWASAGFSWAQRVDLGKQGRNFDFSAAPATKPSKTGTTLPASCSVGETFFKTDAPAGQNLYGCTAANQWTQLSGALSGPELADCKVTVSGSQATVKAPCRLGIGAAVHVLAGDAVATLSGSASSGVLYVYWNAQGQVVADENTPATLSCNALCVTASSGGFPVDSFPLATATFTANVFDAGGVTDKRALYSTKFIQCGDALSCSENGATGVLTVAADTSALLSKSSYQAGQGLLCLASTPTDSYTCAMTPPLLGYASGMVVEFRADQANQGAATLDIDELGARPIKKADGATDPDDGEIAAGRQVPLRYDGAVFRLPPSPGVQTAKGTFAGLPACSSSSRGMVYLFTDSLYGEARCDGASWSYFYDGREVLPPAGVWNWDNQTRTGSASVDVTRGFHQLVVPGNHASGLAVRYQTAPGGSWSRVFAVRIEGLRRASGQQYAIGFRDTAGKLHFLNVFYDSTAEPNHFRVSIRRMSDAVTVVGDADLAPQRAFLPAQFYVKLADDGTNVSFALSADGYSFDTLATLGRTAFLSAPAQIFFGAGTNNAGASAVMDVISIH